MTNKGYKMKKRIYFVIVASAIFFSTTFMGVSSAQAADTISVEPYANTVCESVGSTSYTTSSMTQVQTVTREGIFNNVSSTAQTQTVTESVQTTLSESATGSIGGTVTVDGIIASGSSSFGFTLASANSTTGSGSITTNVTAPAGKKLIAAQGTIKVTDNWSASYCKSTTSVVTSSGTLTDYRLAMETVIQQCDLTPTDALATLVKSKYC